MPLLQNPQQLTIDQAVQRGVVSLVVEAEHGADIIVTRDERPVAVVMGIDRLIKLEEAVEDLRDLAIVLARQATDNGQRISFDEVLAEFGHTRESISQLPDDV